MHYLWVFLKSKSVADRSKLSASRRFKMERNSMKSLEFDSRDDFYHFLESEKDEMYSIIWKGIDTAQSLGETSAYVAEIYLVKERAFIDLISSKEEWEGSLSLAMNYYAQCEEYENCAKLKRLIAKIKT